MRADSALRTAPDVRLPIRSAMSARKRAMTHRWTYCQSIAFSSVLNEVGRCDKMFFISGKDSTAVPEGKT